MTRVLTFCLLLLATMSSANDSLPDFSHVTSLEIAQAMAQAGELTPVLLFPAEFGGPDTTANIVYVPPGISEIKDKITGTLVRFVEQDLVNQLTVTPTYKGDSFVPATIEIKAWHTDKEGGINPTIEIW